MIPENHRRVWDRRLRRRPLLPWLLATTVLLDMACYAVFLSGAEPVLAFGLFLTQMSLLAIWGLSSRSGVLGRLMAIVSANCLLGMLFHPAMSPSESTSSAIALCLGITLMSAAVATLGIVSHRFRIVLREMPEGTSLVIHPRRPRLAPRVWRLGRWNIAALLGVTALVALLAAAVGGADFPEVASMLSSEEVLTIIPLTAAVTVAVAEAAWRAQNRATVGVVAVGAAVIAIPLLAWWSGGSFALLFGVSYFGGVIGTALAWLLGLRVRGPLLGQAD